MLVPKQGVSRLLLCLLQEALFPEMFKYAYTCIFSDIMSKLPSRAIIPKSRPVEGLSVENEHGNWILQGSL